MQNIANVGLFYPHSNKTAPSPPQLSCIQALTPALHRLHIGDGNLNVYLNVIFTQNRSSAILYLF